MGTAILTILSSALGIAKFFAQMAANRQLMEAGEAQQIVKSTTEHQERVKRAQRIKSSVTHDNVDDEL